MSALNLCRARLRPGRFINQTPWLRACYSAATPKPIKPKPRPLDGYRVLDLTRVLAVIFEDDLHPSIGIDIYFSAEVIKVEHPTRGDDTRAWGPPYAPYSPDSGHTGPGESAYYLGVNRNKKSVGISFAHAEGAELVQRLAAASDVLVENYLPGTLAKYGLDYARLSAANPGLIYASITGYGQTGPFAARAGYDVMVEAEFGLMHITGERDGMPVKVGVAVTDLTTGLYTCNAIVTALLSRDSIRRRSRSGEDQEQDTTDRVAAAGGQWLDISLSDCQTATLANIASSCLISGRPDSGRWGTAHPSIVPYRAFPTADSSILFGGGNDRLFGVLCDGLGLSHFKSHPSYATNAQRVANRDELEAAISRVTLTKPTAHWLEVFAGSGLPYAAVNDVKTTLELPHTLARNMVVELPHPACGAVKVVNTPMKFSNAEVGARSPPPTLGQHTDEVLRDVLKMGKTEIEKLRAGGAIN